MVNTGNIKLFARERQTIMEFCYKPMVINSLLFAGEKIPAWMSGKSACQDQQPSPFNQVQIWICIVNFKTFIQKMVEAGSLTKRRPDIACAVSMMAQIIQTNFEEDILAAQNNQIKL